MARLRRRSGGAAAVRGLTDAQRAVLCCGFTFACDGIVFDDVKDYEAA